MIPPYAGRTERVENNLVKKFLPLKIMGNASYKFIDYSII
jgi:hypothetical protein